MLVRLRNAFLVLAGAVAGAVLGRVVLEARHRQQAGLDPMDLDIRRVTLRPQDVVPGVVAALRVHDAPWSWLHIPSPLAAFGVNLGVAAFGGDLASLRQAVERAASGALGFDAHEMWSGGAWRTSSGVVDDDLYRPPDDAFGGSVQPD
ncbi:MAG: hypothetical protein EPO16_00575 [Dehalococcoidia bacterium]|nr:MAG: hypothetical protein EPO16_00575 [Dehalococcoidia bacterium]